VCTCEKKNTVHRFSRMCDFRHPLGILDVPPQIRRDYYTTFRDEQILCSHNTYYSIFFLLIKLSVKSFLGYKLEMYEYVPICLVPSLPNDLYYARYNHLHNMNTFFCTMISLHQSTSPLNKKIN
jgi:hypothetical protein